MKIKIKICGVRCPDMAYKIAKLGVDYIGLIFYSHSRRSVDINAAKKIAHEVRRGGSIPVAVCVDQNEREMTKICFNTGIEMVQLHGNRARKYHQYLPDAITRIYVIETAHNGALLNKNDPYIDCLHAQRDFILFDNIGGGSGEAINTSCIANSHVDFQYFIAGGLCARNIVSVLGETHPYGIDLSSGVEDVNGNQSIALVDTTMKVFNNTVKGGYYA